MGDLTTDPNHPGLTRSHDTEPCPPADTYLVLSEKERARGFVRPVRRSYVHDACGAKTTMAIEIAETYAREPGFYGSTYCTMCRKHLPVGEFQWYGTTHRVGD